jgi:type II secretory pathway pseudopilin PulG
MNLKQRRRNQGGFSLLEVMLVTSMLMTVVATIAVGVRSGHAANDEMRRRASLTALSTELIDRLFRIAFGQPSDPQPPTNEQLGELFDDDDELGDATLSMLVVNPGGPGYSFQLANFPYAGTWEVRVTQDLNSDGDQVDLQEGRDDIVRIDLLYDGVLILETMRAMPVG